MTIQELLLQRTGNKETARSQSLKNLSEIAHEPHRAGPFQNTQRSRERDIPAQRYGPPDLLIDQKHIRQEAPRPAGWVAVLLALADRKNSVESGPGTGRSF